MTTTQRGGARLPRHARNGPRSGRHRIAASLVGVLAFLLTGGVAVYADLQSNITTVDIDSLIDPPPTPAASANPTEEPDLPADPNAGTPLTILVIGSDSRADGAAGDETTSVLADTHLIVHISADRKRLDVVSIPRDIMVERPECRTSSGERIWAGFAAYNSAFAEGWLVGQDLESAIACDVNLAQSATGLTMDGFVLVEMGGFVNIVDALGGVEICLPEPIDAPKANLFLDAGVHVLNGDQALGYARARVGVDDGSDTSRIGRQQRLMSAMMDEVLSRNLLTDAPALYQMLTATLGSLTVSSNLSSVTDMVGLAFSMRDLDRSQITFVTTPYSAYQPDPNRLIWTSATDDIWEAMAQDVRLPASVTGADDDSGTGTGTGDPVSPATTGTPSSAAAPTDTTNQDTAGSNTTAPTAAPVTC
ncbi:MAG: LCP family protein [Beutenbergiaceae bacterium]